MATAIKQLVIVAREVEQDEVCYYIESGENTYISSLVNGVACNCRRTTGESCAAWHYRRSCKHTTLASRNESERASDVAAHLHDEKFSCPSCGQPRKSDTLCYRCAA